MGNGLNDGMIHLSMDYRTVSLDDDTVLTTVIDDRLLLTQRMELFVFVIKVVSQKQIAKISYLDLVDAWHEVSGHFYFFEMMNITG